MSQNGGLISKWSNYHPNKENAIQANLIKITKIIAQLN